MGEREGGVLGRGEGESTCRGQLDDAIMWRGKGQFGMPKKYDYCIGEVATSGLMLRMYQRKCVCVWVRLV